jgi:HEAT repeat protein
MAGGRLTAARFASSDIDGPDQERIQRKEYPMPIFWGPPDVKKLESKRNVKGLINALDYQMDGSIRRATAESLGNLRAGEAVGPLINLLNDKDTEMRMSAVRSLGKIGDPRAIQPLIAVIRNSKWEECRAAADALGQMGAPAVEPLVAALIEWKDYDLRDFAGRALVKIGTPAVDALITTLKDLNVNVRASAAQVLGNIADRRAVEPLLALLSDAYVIRKSAVEALGKLGDARAVVPLIAELNNPQSDIRKPAAEALGKIGDTRAVDPLIAALKDPDREVHHAAIGALGEIMDRRSVEPLIAALTDNTYEVRKSAAEGLVRLYASQQIGADQKQAILTQRSIITQGRVNKNTHQDTGGRSLSDCPSDTHEDYSQHEDFGIGVKF